MPFIFLRVSFVVDTYKSESFHYSVKSSSTLHKEQLFFSPPSPNMIAIMPAELVLDLLFALNSMGPN